MRATGENIHPKNNENCVLTRNCPYSNVANIANV